MTAEPPRRFGPLAGIAACLLGLASPAGAHHIRGIPHYTYSENYPSAPTLEEVRRVGNYTLRMTYFKIPGVEAMDLALYVRDGRTGRPFEGDVTFSVFAADEDPAAAHSVTAYRNKNNIYKAGWDYSRPGRYQVRVCFGSGADAVDEQFALQVGEVGVNWWFLGFSAGGVVMLVVVVGTVNRFRQRARKAGAAAGAGGTEKDR